MMAFNEHTMGLLHGLHESLQGLGLARWSVFGGWEHDAHDEGLDREDDSRRHGQKDEGFPCSGIHDASLQGLGTSMLALTPGLDCDGYDRPEAPDPCCPALNLPCHPCSLPCQSESLGA